MDERDHDLAEAAKRAAEHLPSGQGRSAGVSVYEAIAEAFEGELEAAGYRIERVRGAGRAPSAGD